MPLDTMHSVWIQFDPSEIAALVQACNLLVNVDEGHSLLSIMTERALIFFDAARTRLDESRDRRNERI